MFNGAGRRLVHLDYTIAWICALPCEFAAAQAVLEGTHEDLPIPSTDDNIYSYGSIAAHNIVIVCLPVGVYGTTSAAVVATQLLTTFRNIELSLMVGIGGGVPSSSHDIRLGDVVVSLPTPDCSAVVQYDFGKTIQNGRLERKGHLDKPKRRLLQAVGKLRANHDLKPSKIPTIIAETLQNKVLQDAGYSYPGSDNDILFTPSCEHVEELVDCPTCGPCQVITRPPRSNKDPRIHYGSIASGNQVMKNSRIRDEISRPLGLICFEMEAAGLMDHLQCLVIRGICDYCDARKDKTYQRYASITAAAYGRELLSVIPLSDSKAPTDISPSIQERTQLQEQERINRLFKVLHSLEFEEYGFRMAAINPAHSETCKWLLDHPIYRAWLDNSKFGSHYGLLWLKAKPGAGKSTIMKFAVESMTAPATTISFFFNARGSELERSSDGMYRSLLIQLLAKLPQLQSFLNVEALPTKTSLWTSELLQNTFVSTIRAAGTLPIVCFVDALDEGIEDDIREMLEIFSDLGELNATNNLQFRICFASRYYPHISLHTGLEIRLDEAEEHMKDIMLYIDAKLPEAPLQEMAKVKSLLLSKSGGIFLWVVLVVRILRKEHDHGRIEEMQQKLMVLPNKVHELFRDIILRDSENLGELLLCIQWLLHAYRPLNIAELFFAMHAEKASNVTSAWNSGNLTFSDMIRYIVSSSKGLAEVVCHRGQDNSRQTWSNADNFRVQFIHESVRDFLADESSVIGMWSGFHDLKKGPSHNKLFTCCSRYISVDLSILKRYAGQLVELSTGYREKILFKFPLMQYISAFSLSHAEMACKYGHPPAGLLKNALITDYLKSDVVIVSGYVDEHMEDRKNRDDRCEDYGVCLNQKKSPGSGSDLLDALIRHDLFYLALQQVEYRSNGLTGMRPETIAQLYTAAARIDESDFIEAVLNLDESSQLLISDSNILALAAASGSVSVVRLLLNHGANINKLNSRGKNALHRAAQKGHGTIVELLLDFGADIEACSGFEDKIGPGKTALWYAAYENQEAVEETLLSRGAVKHKAWGFYETYNSRY